MDGWESEKEEWGRPSMSPLPFFFKQFLPSESKLSLVIYLLLWSSGRAGLWGVHCTPLATNKQQPPSRVFFFFFFFSSSVKEKVTKIKRKTLWDRTSTPQSPAEVGGTPQQLPSVKKKDSSDDSFSIYLSLSRWCVLFLLLLPIVDHIWGS